ncbi:MAG: fructose transporter subunit [Proteobacteria bacterium]|jgi:mannose PTS system EIIA component|nr:fructose transporter subunit [Pseudomonadota bacterium]
MTTVLIIAHAPLASALREVAQHAYPDCAADVLALDVPRDASAEQVEADARALISQHSDAETLVFTDVFGATPCRGATLLLGNPRVRLVAGVNVPMLWRTLCYGTREPLDALVARAVAGATQGVMHVTASPPQNQAVRASSDDQAGRHDQQ